MPQACRVVLSALVLTLVAGAAWAQSSQDRFRKLDTNNDGLVDDDEYDAGARASFALLDTNHDGWVTLDELRAAQDPNAGGIGADGLARKQLATMDLNYDNLISEDEFVAFANQSKSSYDKNGDGRLTSDDFGPR
ncbi:EF hand [Pseudoxanthomonas sp. GM95]|uniref:EF-hand domain-containing protein n=1 Tax=Pseudoxanthomonas sp. GM95 TaxID=1881043 RepID=UPI0008CC31D4|nr:EF-hand domain-containing protein [Pseudoxanthomonas sp. GM95]SEM08266.1 EF hand [Pseudoxanthomonas sp. GM95]